ncbi:MAG: 50S ribosomal protein L25/general stress protein Ctc [Gammaproteobacteria bacterium]|nr:50S ribosomal protein L25/general stress protein Ctc [Gammaproteobacteria bacterium]MYD79650.1 50S ribosomal protein L25/general stress protein Ctc [Gammaproteobacteria bacterium]
MPDLLTIDASQRQDVGTSTARRLRRNQDQVPGVVYGGGEVPVHFTIDYRRIAKVVEDEAFFSQVLSLTLGGRSEQVVLRELQRHPATEKVVHVDFLRVREDQELQVSIPFHFLNEEECVGVRLNGGMISHNLTEAQVSCLPRDLPEFVEIDLEHLDIGDAVHLSDIELPPGVSFVVLAQGDGRDDQIVNVHMPRGMSLLDEEEEELVETEEDEEESPEEPEEDSE